MQPAANNVHPSSPLASVDLVVLTVRVACKNGQAIASELEQMGLNKAEQGSCAAYSQLRN